MRVVPLFGFLGSGKTTTILNVARHLTARGQRVAFLINDAGEVQIDGAVVRAGGHEVVEIFDGCLCLMRDDLYLGLSELARFDDLDWVIIEPSGMADANRLNRLLERFPRAVSPELAANYALHRRISLIDAERYDLLMRSVRGLLRDSIAVADTVLLNKSDRLSAAALAVVESAVRCMLKPGAELLSVAARAGLEDALLERLLAA